MIDIHAHLIPGMDDGALSLEESLEMLRMADQEGIETIVATPHVLASLFFSRLSTAKNIAAFHSKFAALEGLVRQHELKIRVLRGAENYFDSLLKEKLIEHADLLTLNGSDYFLLEFPPRFIFPGIKQLMFDLMTDRFIPVICHPERNFVFQQVPGMLYQFVQLGALSQVDAGSIRGDYGASARAAALQFLKLNLVHVIASDCHHPGRYPPGLAFLYDALKKFERNRLDLLLDGIPRAILGNHVPPSIGPSTDPDQKTFSLNVFRRMRR